MKAPAAADPARCSLPVRRQVVASAVAASGSISGDSSARTPEPAWRVAIRVEQHETVSRRTSARDLFEQHHDPRLGAVNSRTMSPAELAAAYA